MTCQECEELSGAYVLGALSEVEQAEVDAHLAHCVDCKHSIQELQQAVDILPLAIPQVEPSPQLKSRVMTKIRSTQRASLQSIRPQTRKATGWTRWQFSVMAAAAILLLAFTGSMAAWNISLQRQISQLSPITTAIQGTAQGVGTHGQITYLPQQNISIVVMQNLPALQGTQVYQGWVIEGKQPASIGVFNVQNGTASLNVQGDVRGYTAVAVSLEPGPQPSVGAPKGPVIALSSSQKA